VIRIGALLAAALAAIALAIPVAAGGQTFYPDCLSNVQYKPHTITVFCADAGMLIRHIHWSRWGATRARGKSSYAYANNCKPSCAEGHFYRYHVRLLLFRVRYCEASSAPIFTRMRVTFTGRKWPGGPRKFTQRLLCDA
jgi:hypothetical protein